FGVITVAQVEAAISIPAARINGGGGNPKPPALRPVEPALEQSASLVDPGLTTAEKIWALEPATCRWPCAIPGIGIFISAPIERLRDDLIASIIRASPIWHRRLAAGMVQRLLRTRPARLDGLS